MLLPATPGWVSLPVVVGGPRQSWLGSAGGGGVWCVVCGGGVLVGLWLVCSVAGPSPLLAEVPVCFSPPLLAGFRCRWWWAVPATPGWGPLAAVVCGVWFVVCGSGVLVGLWLVCGVVGPSPLLAEVPVCYSPPLLAGFRCRWWWAVPATLGWCPLAALVCGVWCVLCGVWRWCVGVVVAGVWCGWSLATPGGGSCVLLPATPGWGSLLVVVGGPRHSWLGSAGGGGVWCVVCGVWCVVCGVWCVVCGGGVLVGLWLVCGVVGPSPLLAEVPVCYSPPLLAGSRCRWWWAVPATPGWGPLRRWCVVCGVWSVAVVCWWGCGWCVVWLVPRRVCLSLGALLLGLGVCAFVSCGFCRFCSVLCAVCCAVLCVPGCGATLRCCALCRPVLCCCVLCCFTALGWCRCSSCRALWCSPSPWGLVLCGDPFCGVPPRCVCFVVACWCVLLFAALLCAVCVLGCCAVRSLSSPLCVVLCFAVVVRLRCAVRVVRAVAGARCCGALPCVVLFPLVCCGAVLGLVTRGCLLVPCCGALLSVLLSWWCWFVSFPCVIGVVLRCASSCSVPVAFALLLVPHAVACPWVLCRLPGRSAVWWCRPGVSWCLAVLCVVLWCPAPCAVSCDAVLPCGVVLVGCAVRLCALLVFVFPFVLFSFAKYPCCFSLPLKTFC